VCVGYRQQADPTGSARSHTPRGCCKKRIGLGATAGIAVIQAVAGWVLIVADRRLVTQFCFAYENIYH
jgi:hypothetical protein